MGNPQFPRPSQNTGAMALDVVREAFEWLNTGPDPVAIDGQHFFGLPDRAVPVRELRDLLLHPACGQATRDAVWTELVTRSRAEDGTWTVVCAGMALPALTRVCAQLCDRFAGDRHDVHSAVLTGFLAALAVVDLGVPRIVLRLRWAAYRGGLAVVRDALAAPVPQPDCTDPDTGAAGRGPVGWTPAGHPDLVLARAVDDGVLSVADAALIGATRLDGVALTDAATARGQSYDAVRKARARAEHRLRTYLRDAAAPPDPDLDFVGQPVRPAAAAPEAQRAAHVAPPHSYANPARLVAEAESTQFAADLVGRRRRSPSHTVTTTRTGGSRRGPGFRSGVSQTGPGPRVQRRGPARPSRRGRSADVEVRSC